MWSIWEPGIAHVSCGRKRSVVALLVSTSREIDVEVLLHAGWGPRYLAKVVRPLLK